MNKRYPAKRAVTAAALMAVAALILGACASGTAEVNKPIATTPTTAAQAASAPTTTTSPVAHVGATLSLSSTEAQADVTLSAIQDPAQGGDQYTTPDDGKRFVGATLTIKNTGSSAFTGDADSDSTIMGSDGQIYTPDFNSLAGCTDFDNGQYQLGAGESATGCVAFQIPNGVTVVKYKFAPDGGYASDFGEWVVP